MDIIKYKKIYDDIWPFAQTFKLDIKKECLNKGIPEPLIDKFIQSDKQIDYISAVSGRQKL